MPLSEQEQRLLDEMERGLYHNDADDVTTVGGRRGRANSTAILLGLIGLVAGVALLIVGVMVRLPVVGVIGFVAMFAGALLLTAGVALQLATAALTLNIAVAGVGWLLAAGGMGTIYPRLSTMMLGHSTPGDQGFNSSALSNIESVGGATAIALGGLLFAAAGGSAGEGFAASILFALVIAALAVPVALRVERAASPAE